MMRFTWIQSGPERLATSIDEPEEGLADEPRPVVVVVHGLTGQRLGRSYHLVEFGRRLAAHGIACVRFDQTASGESTGQYEDVSLPRMVGDCNAVYDWLVDQPWCDAQRLAWTGLSLGALSTLACEAAHPARAVALWAPVFDMPRAFSAAAKTGLRGILEAQGWVPYRGLKVGAEFVETLDAIDPVDPLARSDSPLLLLHSPSDDIVGFDHSEAYEKACRELGRPCELVRVHDADHDFFDYRHRQYAIGRTIDFLLEKLEVRGVPEA